MKFFQNVIPRSLSSRRRGAGIQLGNSGFTLVEIMIALSILVVGLLSLYTAQGNSLRAGGHGEKLQTASLLAKQIMTEKMLEVERDLAKGKFPDDKTEESGEFEAPFQEYRWQYLVRQVDIPVAGEAEMEAPGAIQDNTTTTDIPANAQRSLAQVVTKKLSESLRELTVKVVWEELGEEQSLIVTTHVSRL
jgi:prepilin-type N-terminal cleavage/methylation domain-containing protein